MAKHGENIHKRKDGRWEARYKNGRKPDGAIRYGSVYGKTYKEAKEKMLAVSSIGEKFGRPKISRKTFGEVLLLWLERNRIRCKGSTVRKYGYLINTHIMPKLGCLKPEEISSGAVNAFLNGELTNGKLHGGGGLSPAYVRGMAGIINGAIKFAVAEGICQPLKTEITRPAEVKKELPILSIFEQNRLERQLVNGNDPTAAGVLISLQTGLRIGEICALRWGDIDLSDRIIHVRHTVSRINGTGGETKTILAVESPKTPSSLRDIPISSRLYPVLRKSGIKNPNCYVVSGNPEPLSPRTYEYRYHRLLEACGIRSVNYHALRHTFATRCIEAGVDVKTLSEILGHSNVGVTLGTYVHSSIELKRVQLEKLTALSA